MCAYCFLNYLDSYVNILFVQGCASESSLYFFSPFIYLFLFLAVLGLHCCTRAFSSCTELGLLLVAVHRLLTALASPVWSTGSRVCGLNSRGSQALEHRLNSSGLHA